MWPLTENLLKENIINLQMKQTDEVFNFMTRARAPLDPQSVSEPRPLKDKEVKCVSSEFLEKKNVFLNQVL